MHAEITVDIFTAFMLERTSEQIDQKTLHCCHARDKKGSNHFTAFMRETASEQINTNIASLLF